MPTAPVSLERNSHLRRLKLLLFCSSWCFRTSFKKFPGEPDFASGVGNDSSTSSTKEVFDVNLDAKRTEVWRV